MLDGFINYAENRLEIRRYEICETYINNLWSCDYKKLFIQPMLSDFFKSELERIGHRLYFGWKIAKSGSFYTDLTDDEFVELKDNLLRDYNGMILIADQLDISLAYRFYATNDGATNVGRFMHICKEMQHHDWVSYCRKLVQMVSSYELPCFKDVTHITFMPSSHKIGEVVANNFSKNFGYILADDLVIKSSCSLSGIKSKTMQDIKSKIDKTSGELSINQNYDFNKSCVLIIDDNYHTGVSLNILAEKIKDCYPNCKVYSFCITKMRRNTAVL